MNVDIQKIADTVYRMHLPSGLGDKENACSIAAINLALTGELTDTIPECMSEVIGRWIITIQDAMPDDMRNSAEWKRLLPYAAGTGRVLENERRALLIDHMWSVTLPALQPLADTGGFGKEWQAMTLERTQKAAEAAEAAAARAAEAAEAAEAAAARAAEAAEAAEAAAARAARAEARAAAAAAEARAAAAAEARAAAAARAAAKAEARAAAAAWASVWAAPAAARASVWAAADAAAAAADAVDAAAAADAVFWKTINPCALLQALIEAGQ